MKLKQLLINIIIIIICASYLFNHNNSNKSINNMDKNSSNNIVKRQLLSHNPGQSSTKYCCEGKNYINQTDAIQNGFNINNDCVNHACGDCICITLDDPYCCHKNKEYGNLCIAICNGFNEQKCKQGRCIHTQTGNANQYGYNPYCKLLFYIIFIMSIIFN